jgi:glycine/D-amino acid oxidase-like deaminating enzyme
VKHAIETVESDIGERVHRPATPVRNTGVAASRSASQNFVPKMETRYDPAPSTGFAGRLYRQLSLNITQSRYVPGLIRRLMGLTRKRDLRSGKAVWSAYRHLHIPVRRLRQATRTDVVVVGAGITGALVSHALTEVGIRPLILDRRDGARLGSTAASTALLQFELDNPLVKLGRKIGRRAAEQAWKCSHAAVSVLRTKTHRLGIAAHLESRPSLYLAGNLLDAAGLAREVRARQRLGLPSELLERKALREHFQINRSAAILSHGNAEADPVALAGGFLKHALRRGARFRAPHEVTDLHSSRAGITLFTRDGVEVHARHVVLCTGYELPKIVPAQGNRIISTWAIATRPQPQRIWPQRALVWEASEPYLYLRASFDGRVICGGEDEEFSEARRRGTHIDAKTARLEHKLGRLFPQVDPRAAFAWTGCFGASTTGTPTIGEIPGYPRCYAVMGYGGNGITFSMLAASLITAEIRGKRDPDAHLFDFS